MPGFFSRAVKKYYLKRSGGKGRSAAKMNAANRAMCYALRNPPRGAKPTKYKDIQKLVRKTDKSIPSISAIQEAATTYKDSKGKRGRKAGSNDTTKAEDKKILKVSIVVLLVNYFKLVL